MSRLSEGAGRRTLTESLVFPGHFWPGVPPVLPAFVTRIYTRRASSSRRPHRSGHGISRSTRRRPRSRLPVPSSPRAAGMSLPPRRGFVRPRDVGGPPPNHIRARATFPIPSTPWFSDYAPSLPPSHPPLPPPPLRCTTSRSAPGGGIRQLTNEPCFFGRTTAHEPPIS